MIQPVNSQTADIIRAVTAQNLHSSVQKAPENAVLLGVMKALEVEFQKRGSITASPAGHPLWFLAETERNVFLWRSSLSLADVHEFEFWVDVEKLINKQIERLSQSSTQNPFINPLWSISNTNAVEQIDYFEDLKDKLAPIIPHAAALSHASSLVIGEIKGGSGRVRPVVVLPRERGIA